MKRVTVSLNGSVIEIPAVKLDYYLANGWVIEDAEATEETDDEEV
jgi:hypothetical protein